MTFQKPKDVSYIDMAIYIDDHIYTDSCDLDLVYQYLYLLIYMLAHSTQVLKYKYLDSFALYSANRIYFRITNKKQFEIDNNGEYKMKRIKSIMNYLKSSIYFLKVDYEQSEYYQELQIDTKNIDLSYNVDNIISTSLSDMDLVDFKMTMGDVTSTCKKFLETIPYDKTSVEWLNIYTSTLLTVLNMITLTSKNSKRVEELSATRGIRQYHYDRFYAQENDSKPILFHLSESMSDYIVVLARQVKLLIGRDLSEILHTKVGNDVVCIEAIAEDYLQDIEGSIYED